MTPADLRLDQRNATAEIAANQRVGTLQDAAAAFRPAETLDTQLQWANNATRFHEIFQRMRVHHTMQRLTISLGRQTIYYRMNACGFQLSVRYKIRPQFLHKTNRSWVNSL